jgi:hypothetical protein
LLERNSSRGTIDAVERAFQQEKRNQSHSPYDAGDELNPVEYIREKMGSKS